LSQFYGLNQAASRIGASPLRLAAPGAGGL
jgi:hypothetical protein